MAPDSHGLDDGLNREVERIANMLLHDGISADEQDADKLGAYADKVDLKACGIPETGKNAHEKALAVVYEALLYRKMRMSDQRNGDGKDILDRGSDFGAGFS